MLKQIPPELKEELDSFCADDARMLTKTSINLREEEYEILLQIKQRALENYDYLTVYDRPEKWVNSEYTPRQPLDDSIVEFLRDRGFTVRRDAKFKSSVVSWRESETEKQFRP